LLGSGLPEGWLWAKIREAALYLMASSITPRGETELVFTVP